MVRTPDLPTPHCYVHSNEELAALDFPALIHPEDREHNLGFIRRLLAGELPSGPA